MVNDPDIVFLDEPTTGLDPQARRNLWELIEQINTQDGKTVIITTHYMDEAEHLSHRVAIIDSGQIQALDTPAGLISSLASGHIVRFTSPDPVDLPALERLPATTAATIRANGHPAYAIDIHRTEGDGSGALPTRRDVLASRWMTSRSRHRRSRTCS